MKRILACLDLVLLFALEGKAQGVFTQIPTVGVGFAAGTYEVTLTCGNGAEGSWVELVSSTAAQSKYVIVNIVDDGGAGRAQVDLGTGAAASEQVKAENFHSAVVTANNRKAYPFPFSIPAGTRIAARCQANAGGITLMMSFVYFY